jgi:amino acid transporter
MGIVSTIALLLYGFMSGSNEDLFWSLFTFSAVIFLLPYQAMFLSFIKMRVVDADHPRPFRLPGGLGVARVAAWTCFAVLGLSIALFIYEPGSGINIAVLIGVLLTLALGEVVIRLAENHR